ncbi:Uncharacterised protein [Serratia fonticola]|uniref:Uncharacterized protein n=1 Tax=Serratia fonticola TaxID=47917 RepID=A0A4U9VGS2_SERFO|nr:Uncharacterised protein [Serratia fonticola]
MASLLPPSSAGPSFSTNTELLPELLVGFRIVFGQLVQHLQHTFGQRATQVLGNTAVLQNFARKRSVADRLESDQAARTKRR